MSLAVTTEKQHDGAIWKKYTTDSGVQLTTTQAFRDLMKKGNPNMLNENRNVARRLLILLRKYRSAFEDQYYDDIRKFIIQGGEAEFFGLGETNIGIREVTDNSDEQKRNTRNLSKMTKMDVIEHLLNLGSLPRWIKIPAHYAMLNIPKTNEHPSRNFVMMDKIDHCVTVQDIIEPRDNPMRINIINEFGQFYNFDNMNGLEYTQFKKEVEERYSELVVRLKAAFLEHKASLPKGLKFEDIFTDLFERNVLITYNPAPIGGSKVSFWIIDQ